jgi:hypothetical protein
MRLPNLGEDGKRGKSVDLISYQNGIKNRLAGTFSQPRMANYLGKENDILKSTIRHCSRNVGINKKMGRSHN